MSSTALEILLQEVLMLTHYYSATQAFCYPCGSITRDQNQNGPPEWWSFTVSKATAMNPSLAWPNHLGLQCIILLCLLKLVVYACGSGLDSLRLEEELIILVFGEKQAKKKMVQKGGAENECWMFRQLTHKDRHPGKSPQAKMEIFLSLSPYFVIYY